MATHSQGAFGLLAFDTETGATPTFDANSIPAEFIFEDMRFRRRIIGKTRGIRGRLSRASERAREGLRSVRGRVAMYMTPNNVERLLVDNTGNNIQMLGMTAAGDVHSLSDPYVLPSFAMLIGRETGFFRYTDCKLNSLTIQARAPQQGERGEPELVVMILDIIATTEDSTGVTSWPATVPDVPFAAIDAPYTLMDTNTGITLFGEVRPVEELRITWENFLQAKAVNSLNIHSLRPRDRRIQVYARIPWNSDMQDLHTTAVAGATGSIVFTNGPYATTFSFANLQQEVSSPTIRGKNQISYELFAEAGSSGDPDTAANREIQITNDITL